MFWEDIKILDIFMGWNFENGIDPMLLKKNYQE